MIAQLLTLLVLNGNAMQIGSAPWCEADDYGNLNCIHYSLSSCQSAIKYDSSKTCVHK